MQNQIDQKYNPIEEILRKQSVLILDGALATELESYGCDLDDPLWSARVLLEKPEAIAQVHLEYFRAGADCAITASYQATLDGFLKRGIPEEESVNLIQTTVQLARKARDDFWAGREHADRSKPLVAGSVGPYGAYLADGSEYIGNYSVTDEQLSSFHRPRIKALVEAGADLLAFETIPSFQEAKVLTSLLKEFPDMYGWLSFSLKDGEAISDGTKLQECAREFNAHEQIAAIGVNCSPMKVAAEAVRILHTCTDMRIIVYPNSGETYDPRTKTWQGDRDHIGFDARSQAWYEAGASIIGGCCRTTPQHIKNLAKIWK